MRRAIVIVALALSVMAAACSEEEPVTAAEGDRARGESEYVVWCSDCHGETLFGGIDGPSLLEPEYFLPGFSDEEMWEHIRHGSLEPEGDYEPMPGFPNIGRRATADIMAYVRAAQAGTR